MKDETFDVVNIARVFELDPDLLAAHCALSHGGGH